MHSSSVQCGASGSNEARSMGEKGVGARSIGDEQSHASGVQEHAHVWEQAQSSTSTKPLLDLNFASELEDGEILQPEALCDLALNLSSWGTPILPPPVLYPSNPSPECHYIPPVLNPPPPTSAVLHTRIPVVSASQPVGYPHLPLTQPFVASSTPPPCAIPWPYTALPPSLGHTQLHHLPFRFHPLSPYHPLPPLTLNPFPSPHLSIPPWNCPLTRLGCLHLLHL